jgi:type II secretion system protein H
MARRGFTLIELLLVMAMIALLTGIIAFSTGVSTQWSKFHQDATSIYSLCKHARATAIAQSKRVRVEIDTTLKTYKLTIEADPEMAADTFTSPEGSWSETFNLNDSVTATLTDRVSGDASILYVTFNPDGTADPVDIDLTHESFTEILRITINEITAMAELEVVDETE